MHPSKVQQPPQVITIQESDEACFTELEFGEDERSSNKKVHHKSFMHQKLQENDEGLTLSRKIKIIKEK